MQYVSDIFTSTLEVKQSKFIAYLLPYNKYEQTLDKLKSQHPKARHFVVAYRYLNEYEQIVEHCSDDGEPKNTSGKPSLFVLQGAEMINTAVIVVRYFGGTKLGTGGLVRAYSDAVNLVLQNADILQYTTQMKAEISFAYSDLRVIEYELCSFGIKTVEKIFQDNPLYKIEGSKEDMEQFLQKVKRSLL